MAGLIRKTSPIDSRLLLFLLLLMLLMMVFCVAVADVIAWSYLLAGCVLVMPNSRASSSVKSP